MNLACLECCYWWRPFFYGGYSIEDEEEISSRACAWTCASLICSGRFARVHLSGQWDPRSCQCYDTTHNDINNLQSNRDHNYLNYLDHIVNFNNHQFDYNIYYEYECILEF